MNKLLILFFFLSPCIIAQSNYTGIYIGNNYEKDSVLKVVSKVIHKLILEKDSSFTYMKNNNSSCNSIYGGFWETEKGKVVLNFVGDDPQWMVINEGAGFCVLENRKDQLTLIKQGQRQYEYDSSSKSQPVKPKKNRKEPPCPSFKKR